MPSGSFLNPKGTLFTVMLWKRMEKKNVFLNCFSKMRVHTYMLKNNNNISNSRFESYFEDSKSYLLFE